MTQENSFLTTENTGSDTASGQSGARYAGKKRTGRERLQNIGETIKAGDAFRKKCEDAGDNTLLCADLMAEAIEMLSQANALDPVGKDGRCTFSIEVINANHCLLHAKQAYQKARRKNSQDN